MSQPKHIARKRFGQNFLVDGAIIDNIVRAIAPQAGQPMVEIGPGLMALTQPLLERLGQLTVIELDRDLATRLRGRQGLNVVESDVLKVDFTALAHTLGAPKLRVVGNLPYNISSPILFHLLDHVVNIAVMQIKRTAVNIDELRQLAHGDVLDRFFAHELRQSRTKLHAGLSNAAIHFLIIQGETTSIFLFFWVTNLLGRYRPISLR